MLEKLLKRINGRAIVAGYLFEAGEMVEALQATLARGEAQAAGEIAHRLKGSSGYVGAKRLTTLSAALEQQGRAGRVEGAMDLLNRLQAEFEQVRRTLELKTGVHQNGGKQA